MRNKNAGREAIDYDLNIFCPEQWDEVDQDSYYDPTSWYIHVYKYVTPSGHQEVGEPFKLSQREIEDLCLGKEGTYFDDYDSWYGMDGFLKDYWDCLSDRIKQFLEGHPKYA